MNAAETPSTRKRRDVMAIVAGVLLVFVGVLLGSLAGWFVADFSPKLRRFIEGIGVGNYDTLAAVGAVLGLALGLVAGYFLSYRLSRRYRPTSPKVGPR